jgi:hypothetical protein
MDKIITITAQSGRYAIIKTAETDYRPYYKAGTIVMQMYRPDGTPIGEWQPVSTTGNTIDSLVTKAKANGSLVTERQA